MRALSEGKVKYCEHCAAKGVSDSPIKPAVVFFGEKMPQQFYDACEREKINKIDLLIIVGTTLKVKPFGNVEKMVKPGTPKVLLNATKDDVFRGNEFDE